MPVRPFTLARAATFTWRSLVVGFGVVVVTLVLSRLRLVVLPVIIALLLTTILQPLVEALVRRRIPRFVSTWLVLVLGIGSLVALGFALAPSIASEFGDLGDTLQEGRAQVEEYLASGPLGLDGADLEGYIERAGEELSGRSSQIASGVLAGAVLAFELVAGLLLVLVLAFFFLKDGDRFTSFALRQVRAEHRDVVRAVGVRAWDAATGYVRGTALVALVDATIIGVGLLIIGVPLVLPLALLTFFGAFFPIVGAVLAGVLAALVTLVTNGVTPALIIAGVIVLIQQIEGDVLQPLVMGKAVRLHPLVILVALTAGGVLGGIAGAFVAVPVTAVGATVGNYMRTQLRDEAELTDKDKKVEQEIDSDT
jgi:predicted PurR-regulated permease PerM